MTSESTGGEDLQYGYDPAGDRTSITWADPSPNQLTATNAYDDLQRVTGISANGSLLASYSYDDLGRRSAITPTNSTGAS
ncbi:MAG: hypothetical protein ACRED8_13885, partial [Caulobacteraceae bacterium]